jgi:hypothetical protein
MSKHTPGPLHVQDNRAERESGHQIRVDSPFDGAIAVLASSDQGLAYAHLFAAAPEMLEALNAFVINKSLLKADEPFIGAFERLIKLSEEVIAKAKGLK